MPKMKSSPKRLDQCSPFTNEETEDEPPVISRASKTLFPIKHYITLKIRGNMNDLMIVASIIANSPSLNEPNINLDVTLYEIIKQERYGGKILYPEERSLLLVELHVHLESSIIFFLNELLNSLEYEEEEELTTYKIAHSEYAEWRFGKDV